MTSKRAAISELKVWPRGLSLPEAARYVGVSPETFLKFVRVPCRRLGARKVWDRAALDAWFDTSPGTMDDDAPAPTMEEAAASWGKSQ